MEKLFFTCHTACARTFTVFLILLGLQSFFANKMKAQDLNETSVVLTKSEYKFSELFKEIEQQTPFRFTYFEDEISTDSRYNTSEKEPGLKQLLDDISRKTNLDFYPKGKIITVSRAKPGKTANTNAAVQRIISGTVTDAEQIPLPGVSVVLKGTQKGTAADFDGKFQIQAAAGDVLIFSYIGYLTREVTVGENSILNVRLQTDTNELNEVVVVGYGTQKKADLTGAISSVDVESFENIPTPRVDQMLQGRAAGVEVKSINGSPGAGTTIRIRGSRSINASNEPLYVIDGIVGAGDLNTINPADIESIDILKDASAAAIYGSRASNGVVIITTKNGKPGKDRFHFSATYGISELTRSVDMMTTEEYIPFINEAYEDRTGEVLYPDPDSVLERVGPGGTDWIDEIIQTGTYANYDMAVSGGNEDFTYRFSGNIVDQKGIAIKSTYRRYQSRLNMTKKFSSRLKMGVNINASRYYREPGSNINFGSNSGWSSSMITLPPTMPVYNEDGTFNSYNPVRYTGGGHVNTAVAAAHLNDAKTTYNNLLGSVYGEFEILKGLKLKSSFGTRLANSRYNFYRPSYAPANVANDREFGDALSDIYHRYYVLNENTLTFDRSFGNHHLNILGGFTFQRRIDERVYVRGGGLTNDIVKWNDFESIPQDQRNTVSHYNENAQTSFIGRIGYDFNKKYYVTFTSRYDGASNFSANKKWGYFPSLGIRWRASKEEFYKNSGIADVLTDLSFRASYGISGNQGISNYRSLATLSADETSYIFGDEPVFGYTQGRLANDNLSWETSRQLNIGADIQLLKGRFNLSANYYRTTTDDLLLTVQMPRQTGYGSRLKNLGETLSKGLEFELDGTIIRGNDFSWNAVVNIATNEQEVVDIGALGRVALDDNGYGATTNFLEVGVPIGANFGVEYMGTWKNQEEIDAELAKPEEERTLVSTSNFYQPGKPKYKDHNGDGELNSDDYHYLGTPNPKLYGGIGNTLRYKNLTLDFFLQFAEGNTMWNYIEFFVGTGTYLTNQMKYMKDRWTPENPDSDIPGVNSRDNIPSTRFLHDASFLRLKSLSLSYDLSPLVFPGKDKRLSVYLSGTNLFLITRYNGFDPEVNTGGTSSTVRARDNGAYPNSSTFTMGFNLEL
ncbi:TonB-dependent receptor [Sinomicrobium kalidii]|uniref:SusC/RagA family TonB-linked outer membrane protein n=1 Tax=Sinomicrobium kalidii TaxID=2900738 RepID=UPI001E2ED475|nr:TonB-dependent receptor [Sinomicrobium kalidii]UGU15932.1 TonB-dependent receptor [Sinomicrobium kalidii]